MSKRGTDFLELWMLANVKAGGNAANLAVRCAADALMGGLSLEEIEEEAAAQSLHRRHPGAPGRWYGRNYRDG
jgi:2-iminoacetate synthase ThiH